MRSSYRDMKRALDLVLATALLLVTSPLWVVASVGLKLEGHQGILFRQTRWGLHGKTFEIRKFRTMRVSEEEGNLRAVEDPTRITKWGRFLRATGIDELPQLVNILFGEMSFVGPRPLAVGETVPGPAGQRVSYRDIPGFEERLRVKPGLTSPATVLLPKGADPQIIFEYDIRYVRDSSLLLDLKTIFASLWISVTAGWSRRGN